MRIAITGGPRTGKTTMAGQIHAETGSPVVHGDDYIGLGWSQCSAAVADEMRKPGPWVAEGVQVPRALRKMIDADPTAKPCDRLLILSVPHCETTRGQDVMAKGVAAVLAEVVPPLLALGVEVVTL